MISWNIAISAVEVGRSGEGRIKDSALSPTPLESRAVPLPCDGGHRLSSTLTRPVKTHTCSSFTQVYGETSFLLEEE